MGGTGELEEEPSGAGPEGWRGPGRGRAEPVRVREGCLSRAFKTADCVHSGGQNRET